MQKKILKYTAVVLAILLVIFLSLDIHRLDSARARPAAEVFKAEAFVEVFWEEHLPARLGEAVPAGTLFRMLEEDPDRAFENYSHKLGISNTHYFFIRGEGFVNSVEEEYITVGLDDNKNVELETVFIFGNAVRDGSGLVNIDDFENMMDFNLVSVYINRKVKREVADPLRDKASEGMRISFTGAAEINRLDIQTDRLKIIPLKTELDYAN
jgi:predicted lipoprotein